MKKINKENLIAQVEVNPKLSEGQNPSIPIPGNTSVGDLTCFVLAISVFYKLLMK
ncbi:MAG: hypothetical protein KME09_21605 [Pleurocapsa minor HA4230-MV1]|jgi:hypothetical protein|nr:hypothetical protein [Pleurocapsa minor HA4230-MV1]